MLLAASTHTVELSAISILREDRQRREIDTTDLDDSIRRNGVLQPIIVRPRTEADPPGSAPGSPFILVAGERRYTSSVKAGRAAIPAVSMLDLPPEMARIVELEENVKRQELPWRDHVKALGDLHEAYQKLDEEHSQSATAKAASVSEGVMSIYLRVYRDLDNPRIARCSGMREAYNVLKRIDDRAMEDALSDLAEASVTIGEKLDQTSSEAAIEREVTLTIPPVQELISVTDLAVQAGRPLSPRQIAALTKPRIKPAEDSILQENFLTWSDGYSGPKFNLLHCDFPYGIEAFNGPMSGEGKWETYDDSASSYWDLLRALARNMDRIATPSAHMVFWFSMEWYEETLQFFDDNMGDWAVQRFPLIWHKSDNVGVLPDAKRGPRRVYETALFASRGDRSILKPISNLYSCPTDKRHHHSTKPEQMLRHFFQMTVDENTKLLDPTCGSGSALRAAESMGAGFVLGLESSSEHCENARKALRSFRVLREAGNV